MKMKSFLTKNTANIITFLRIPCAIIILINGKFNYLFYLLFLLGSFTDSIDGAIARKYNLQSRFGSILDSVADIFFFGSALYVTLSTNANNLNDTARIMLVAVVIFRVICYLIGYIKFKTLAALHTFLNKLTAIAIFISIMAIPFIGISIPCIITCTIALAAVFEEIMIVLISPSLLSDTSSLIHTLKKIERRH